MPLRLLVFLQLPVTLRTCRSSACVAYTSSLVQWTQLHQLSRKATAEEPECTGTFPEEPVRHVRHDPGPEDSAEETHHHPRRQIRKPESGATCDEMSESRHKIRLGREQGQHRHPDQVQDY
ncbi:hypothetical protein PC110_g5899 [Phytophthora cactorum]|uniref:Secreted protein n=1 Tax=Phytophthora cactorum TaxID=29920 RepID=A0A329SLW7_9STRA|nr:hypothetical protein PC120_g17490 [Phytophthora cactorum]RAW37833.1 hypothetical protein PC110_g5899 [Phytophthora cactorum]